MVSTWMALESSGLSSLEPHRVLGLGQGPGNMPSSTHVGVRALTLKLSLNEKPSNHPHVISSTSTAAVKHHY